MAGQFLTKSLKTKLPETAGTSSGSTSSARVSRLTSSRLPKSLHRVSGGPPRAITPLETVDVEVQIDVEAPQLFQKLGAQGEAEVVVGAKDPDEDIHPQTHIP